MFGFRRNKSAEEDSVAASFLGIVATLARDTSIALKDWVKEDWVNTDGARFELGVYAVFKIDHVACRRLSEEDRGRLMDQCEYGLAVSFENTQLGASREQLVAVIASRMESYGKRAQGKKEFSDLAQSLINGLCLYMKASGMRNRVEAEPPIVICDFMTTMNLTTGLIACEKHIGGFDFWEFVRDVFQHYPHVFTLSGAQITAAWEKYRAARIKRRAEH